MEERRLLWDDIKHHNSLSLFKNRPWILIGDFNEILSISEHSNPTASWDPQGMREFQDTTREAHLTDLGSQGPLLTWSNKRDEGLVCKKLDRALVNEEWVHVFNRSYCVFDLGGCSDHSRIRVEFTDQDGRRDKRPFKFSTVLTKLPQFLPTIQAFWESTTPLFISTSALHRFSKKLKDLKLTIRELGRQKLGDLSKKTKEALSNLCDRQAATLSQPTVEHMKLEARANERWHHLSELEESFLKQRSKLHWLMVGDRNNAYFYKGCVLRQQRNMIHEIKDTNGNILKDKAAIKNEASNFFKTFLNSASMDLQGQGMTPLELSSLIHFRCTSADQAMLETPVSAEDIRNTLFSMPNNKSPGPDGYTAEFYKSSWAIIGTDFTAAITSFFEKGFLPKGINSTILALIPKKEDSMEMKDFRPISCCNVLYKVISKILATRLKIILPKIIM